MKRSYLESTQHGGRTNEIVISPSSSGFFDLAELWNYRELLWVLTARDIKVRYKQTVFGVAWAVIQPVATMLVLSVVFGRLSHMPSDGIPYPVFVYVGLLGWTFFSAAVSRASSSVVGASNLITKIYFPRIVIPISSIGSALIDLLVSSVVLIILLIVFEVGPTWRLLTAPFLVGLAATAAFGVGTIIAALTVAYRDFNFVTPFLMQLWMFMTPVIYPTGMVPENWRWLFYLNPMTGVVDGCRAAFLGLEFNLVSLAVATAVSISLATLGLLYFHRVERRFADII